MFAILVLHQAYATLADVRYPGPPSGLGYRG
jgi:hypothetical protein